MVEDRIRVAILGPTLAVRVGLRTILSTDESVDVVADGTDLATLEIELDRLDAIVLQGEVPIDKWHLTGDIKSQVTILWVSDDPQVADILRSIPIRSWGIVHPDADEAELITALHAVTLGYILVPPRLLEPILTESYQDATDNLVETLTLRETEVLQLLAQGLANKQIAMDLEISEHTVKFHISSIYGKLNAANRTEAVRIGLRSGLIVL